MVMLLPWGTDVKGYLHKYGDVPPNVQIICPKCKYRRMHRHGRYYRLAATREEIYRIPVYRQYCPPCRFTVSLLPDFVKPYAIFVTPLREHVIYRHVLEKLPLHELINEVSSEKTTLLSEKTLYRWVKGIAVRVPVVTELLARRILKLSPGRISTVPTPVAKKKRRRSNLCSTSDTGTKT